MYKFPFSSKKCLPLCLQVHVVFKASSPNTKEVALQFLNSLSKCYVTVEVVIANRLTSAILTQVGSSYVLTAPWHGLCMGVAPPPHHMLDS